MLNWAQIKGELDYLHLAGVFSQINRGELTRIQSQQKAARKEHVRDAPANLQNEKSRSRRIW